jgi:hypothetical protein
VELEYGDLILSGRRRKTKSLAYRMVMTRNTVALELAGSSYTTHLGMNCMSSP